MNFPSEALRCVVFLGHADTDDSPQSFEPRATGFFVVQPLGDGEFFTVLITARHCVRAWFEDPFHIRFNGSSEGLLTKVENPSWLLHDNPDVDVAAMVIRWPAGAETRAVPTHMLLPEKRLGVGDMGPGDLTYTVGLFTYLSGKRTNVPLVHTGHIAAFPGEERIPFPDWDYPASKPKKFREVEAFIVQCSAMPGASGSPVFVRKPVMAADIGHVHDVNGRTATARVPPMGYGAMFLLGMWQGAWELDTARFVGTFEVRDPAGYGLVVPAQRILEILDKVKASQSV